MNTRHPWTFADDFVRALGPINRGGVVLSRSDAGQIIRGIAVAIGMAEEQLAILLSEAEQAKTDQDHSKHTDRLMREMGFAAPEPTE